MKDYRFGKVYCPICQQRQVMVLYPYDSFVKHHRHPVKRFFTGYPRYGAWLREYYEDLYKIKEKEIGKI
jgi:hypothetical protein